MYSFYGALIMSVVIKAQIVDFFSALCRNIVGLAEPIALVLEINGRLSRRLDDGPRCLVVVLVFFFHVYREQTGFGLAVVQEKLHCYRM